MKIGPVLDFQLNRRASVDFEKAIRGRAVDPLVEKINKLKKRVVDGPSAGCLPGSARPGLVPFLREWAEMRDK